MLGFLNLRVQRSSRCIGSGIGVDVGSSRSRSRRSSSFSHCSFKARKPRIGEERKLYKR